MIKSEWNDDSNFIAWAPMLTIPQWAKERIEAQYKKGRKI